MKSKILIIFAAIVFSFVGYSALKASLTSQLPENQAMVTPAVETASDKYPFFPSLVRVAAGANLRLPISHPLKIVAACHDAIHSQWDGSMLSNSFKDPVVARHVDDRVQRNK